MGSLRSAHGRGDPFKNFILIYKAPGVACSSLWRCKAAPRGFAWVEFEVREKLQKEGATGDSCPELRIGTPHLNQP